jgi:hypothetical protein
MIKPGTLCMIRGLPSDSPSAAANGRVVSVIRYLGDYKGFADVHQFEPYVLIMGQEFDKAQEKWLHPFDTDNEDILTKEALDRAIENTFRETLEKQLGV